jgi:hypothetical protein
LGFAAFRRRNYWALTRRLDLWQTRLAHETAAMVPFLPGRAGNLARDRGLNLDLRLFVQNQVQQ